MPVMTSTTIRVVRCRGLLTSVARVPRTRVAAFPRTGIEGGSMFGIGRVDD